MKHWKLAVALVCFGTAAQAKQFGLLPDDYLRPIDLEHPVTSVGFFVDPKDPGQTSFGKSIALVTHDPSDGCLLPSVVCEQWAPVATGFSINAGKLLWTVGSLANLAPAGKAGLLWVTNALTHDEQLEGLKSVLAPTADNLTFAFGPQLALSPVQHGVILPIGAWGPRLVIFTGAQIKW